MSNNSVQGGSDTIRDLDRLSGGVKTQVMQLDFGGDSTNAEQLVSLGNPLPVNLAATNFTVSAVNSTTTQLAPGAVFSGAIENSLNQPVISFLMTADQPIVLTLYQYIDVAGTYAVAPRSWVIPASANNVNFSFTINSNYFKVTATNAGGAATTTLNLNVSYGNEPPVTALGNAPVAINEVGGVAVSNGKLPVAVPDVINVNDLQLLAAQTNDSPIGTFITGDPAGNYAGVNILESLMDGDLQMPVATPDIRKGGANSGLVLADMDGPYYLTQPAPMVFEMTGYTGLTVVGSGGAGTINFFASDSPGGPWLPVQANVYNNSNGTSPYVPATVMVWTTAVTMGVWIPAVARYIRLLGSAFTAGVATIHRRTGAVINTNAQQSNLQLIGGAALAAENATSPASVLGVGGLIRTATRTAGTAGTSSFVTLSAAGQLITKPYSMADTDWQFTGTLTTTTAAAAKAAGAAGVRNYVTDIVVQNTNATATTFIVLDGATAIWTISLPASMTQPLTFGFRIPLKGTAATALNVNCGTTGANVLVNMQGYQAV
jgi:hypothetical protein